MKKIIVLTMICALVFSMTAWGAAPETSPDNKEAAVEEAVAEDAEALSMDSADISPLGAIMFYAILEAAMDVDLEEKAAAGDDGFSEDGTVFSLLEDVLTEITEGTGEDGTEDEDTLSQLVYGLSTLGEEDEMSEEELDDLLGLMLLAIGAEEEETESEAVDLSSYSVIGYDIAAYVIAAVEANEVIAEAVEATDSTLFEILESFIDADANNADADALNARLADLEAELEKVADYIDTTEGPKHAALDLLGIVDTIADESIAYYYGHTYADAE